MTTLNPCLNTTQAQSSIALMKQLWDLITCKPDTKLEKDQGDFQSYVLSTHPIKMRISRNAFYHSSNTASRCDPDYFHKYSIELRDQDNKYFWGGGVRKHTMFSVNFADTSYVKLSIYNTAEILSEGGHIPGLIDTIPYEWNNFNYHPDQVNEFNNHLKNIFSTHYKGLITF